MTDDQLAQRLRDQTNAPAASSFTDLASAQKFTQAALNDHDNAIRIDEWLQGVEKKKKNNPNWDPNNSSIQPQIKFTFNEDTGSTITRADYDAHGMGATATKTRSVQVALKYKEGMDPPFVVVTSMPIP
ncbi:hypothetical protein BG418_28345 [Streptomyces sp. CBMA152]|nr:hypothetical protein [Streptomyces sp. CBMA152]